MKAEEVRRGRMKRHTPKCIRAIERKHPVLGLEQVMKVFDVLVAARLLARVLVHLAVVVDYALLPVAGSRVDARPTEEVLSAREERLIGPQAVPLVQVGDGELHVRVGDHERGQLEGLGLGVELELDPLRESSHDFAGRPLLLPPSNVGTYPGGVEHAHGRADESTPAAGEPPRDWVQRQTRAAPPRSPWRAH